MKLSLGVVLLIAVSATELFASSRVIGGTEVSGPDWDFVVRLGIRGAGCTGAVVGKNAILTAAHCIAPTVSGLIQINDEDVEVDGKRSPLYPMEDHDVALLVTASPLPYRPAILGDRINMSDPVFILGFGCMDAGGSDNPGTLRRGAASVTELKRFDAVLKGAALCFGDSGGPAVLQGGPHPVVVGTGSKGNLLDTSYIARMDTNETSQFLQRMIADYGAEICGFNVDCP
jgi:hypothetical protein